MYIKTNKNSHVTIAHGAPKHATLNRKFHDELIHNVSV